jgi:hypothetical protein
MSTTSQHMGLKIPDGSDPFLRTDFVNNYNIQDEYTGDWICTSTTRPVWGAAQAGMKIIETDTRRTMLWTGTTFRELLYAPAVWSGHMRPNIQIAHGTTVNYTLGTFSVARPGTLLTWYSVEISMPTRGAGGGNYRSLIDGAEANVDTPAGGEFVYTAWPNTSTMGTQNWVVTVPLLGLRNISAGTHSVGIRAIMDIANVALVKLTSIRVVAMLVNGTDR